MLDYGMNPSKTRLPHVNDKFFNPRQNLIIILKERKGEGYWTVRR
jgi:hypothetical protein